MRIAMGLDTNGSVDATLERARRWRDLGFTSQWSSQIFGPDTLTVLAVVGHELRDLDLGTAVVPVQPRHPAMLAAQARTVADAIGGRLTLGVGLSHQVIVEGMWGLSFERPVSYLEEYLAVLAPMLRGEPVRVEGERLRVTATGPVGPSEVEAPGLLVAALGPRMLELAGQVADGTVLWMTGAATIEDYVAPQIRRAAAAAGRPEPRIVCSLPITVTDDLEGARQRINEAFAVYPTLPSYAAVMAREGASEAADVAIVGSREHVLEQLSRLALAGVSEFSAAPTGSRAERDATVEVLIDFAGR